MDNVNNRQPYHENEPVSLDDIFKRIVNGNGEVEVSLQGLARIIEHDMKIPLDHLDEAKRKTLPYMFSRYTKNWPGWSKKEEYNGILDLESYSQRFQNYIRYKMEFLVTLTLPKIDDNSEEDLHTDNINKVEAGSQTDFPVSFSKFNLDMSGPASLLNNLVFSGHKGDIRVEEHMEREWIPLEYGEVLNYPFVEVEFNSPELSFKRSLEPKLTQYLSCKSDFQIEESDFILGRSHLNSDASKWPIKTSILKQYITAYKAQVSSTFSLSEEQQEELGLVLDQFYQDMVDVSVNGQVADNRRIIFNIGKNSFKRTKKMSHKEPLPDVIFNEMCLPRVVTSFRFFTGMQNDSALKRTADPDKIDSKTMLQFQPVISYRCNFCKAKFEGCAAISELMSHLEKTHKRSQPLVCLRCKRCIEIAELSRRRWTCQCQGGV